MRQKARSVALLAGLALAPRPAFAQHILGTAFDGGFVRLVDLNPATGVASFIGSATDAASISGQSAYDAAGNRYFFLGTPTAGSLSLYVVDGTGASYVSGALSGATYNNVFDIEYDPSGDVLYGFFDVGTPSGEKRLGSIDHTPPGVGTVTLLGTGSFSGGASIPYSGVFEIDPTLNRAYFIGGNIYGVDYALASPDVYANGLITPLVQGLEPDTDSGVLYALEINGSDRRLAIVETGIGNIGQINTTGADLNPAGDISTDGRETSDSAGNVYYFLGTPTAGSLSLYAVSTSTLTLAGGYPVALSGQTSVSNFEFDGGTLPVSLSRFTAD